MGHDLTILDFLFVFIYFVALILIGYFSSRKQSSDSYLIAERKLGTWTTMATINASKTGSILMTFVAITFLWGVSAVWYFVGMVVGIFLFLPFALKLKEKSKNIYYTLADYFKHNYGKKAAIAASALSIFLMFGLAVVNIIAGTQIFTFFTGWSFWLCTIIMTVVVLIYLLFGGFKAVVKTDVLQYIAMCIILLLLVFLVFDGSLIPPADLNLFAATPSTMIGFFIVGVMFPFAGPDIRQRVYSSKGKTELKRGLIRSAIIYAIFGSLLALIALVVKAKFPDVDPNMALLHGFANLLPAGIVGLSIVLLFAAIMSSVDTYLYTSSSALIQDFFVGTKERIVKLLRKTLLAVTVVAALIAILIQDLVVSTYIFVAFYNVVAIPVIATWCFPKIRSSSLVGGFVVGSLGTLAILIIFLTRDGASVSPILVIGAMISTIVGLLLGQMIKIKR